MFLFIDNFTSSQIFRIHGDEFAIINKKHRNLEIDLQKCTSLGMLKDHNITITNHHIDLRENNVTEINELEYK